MRSAFHGHIDEIPFIHVDNFENSYKSAYFLSHYHADHVYGIKSCRLQNNLSKTGAFIYSSEVTAAIITKDVPDLAPFLKILKLRINTITIKEDGEERVLDVTMVPAGHSLGSVMFLFQYNNKKILYTGDFRISPNSVAKYTDFHKNGQPIDLDTLYVDTTFQYVPSFPRRSEVVRNIVIHIQNWLNQSSEHNVMMLTCAKFGYEFVCNEIYNLTKMKTCIPSYFWDIYSQFPKELYGVTDDTTSRLHLESKYTYKGSYSPNRLVIYFSAYQWKDRPNIEEEFLECQMDKQNRIDVCFSTHCGRDELLYFINYFKTNRVVGFPEKFDANHSLSQTPDTDLTEDIFKITPQKRKCGNSGAIEKSTGKKVGRQLLQEAFDW